MLDLFTEPAYIAAFGTIGGGVALKITEGVLIRKKAGDTVAHDIWSCGEWETRHREANPFLHQGEPVAVKDMTVCIDEKCLNCAPTREANKPKPVSRPKPRPIPALSAGGSSMAKPLRSSYYGPDHNKDKCRHCDAYLSPGKVHVACNGKGHTEYIKKSKSKMITPVIPPATYTNEHGKPLVSIESKEHDVDDYEIVSADGTTIKKFRSITDPDTGEHLGTLVLEDGRWRAYNPGDHISQLETALGEPLRISEGTHRKRLIDTHMSQQYKSEQSKYSEYKKQKYTYDMGAM